MNRIVTKWTWKTRRSGSPQFEERPVGLGAYSADEFGAICRWPAISLFVPNAQPFTRQAARYLLARAEHAPDMFGSSPHPRHSNGFSLESTGMTCPSIRAGFLFHRPTVTSLHDSTTFGPLMALFYNPARCRRDRFEVRQGSPKKQEMAS
ncbi:hypothetical protein [Mesorhizobium huakuii]|uniref:Uncharacterized protein n=1 Tax=Mesorhizobium huakuii TaxID=28104 RepID=A0A7G6T5L0_9HYPH|nr:hypothetical protein [Mesorhizobium huakuii]QND62042.1 hypothetical protein HB778_38715 [Mesorhizobium huakuii]QND69434.1 hypothetical protein HB777_37825 [Mesorhizobium loti]